MNQSQLRFIYIAVALMVAVFAWLFWHQDGPVAGANANASTSASADAIASAAASAPTQAAASAAAVTKLPGVRDEPGLLPAPEAEKFDVAVLEDRALLSQYLNPAQRQQALALLKNQHCESQKISVYFKKDVAEKLLVSDCYYLVSPGQDGNPGWYDTDYGIMLVVDKTGVVELKDITQFKFMYESSKLSAVTSLNKNGRLQLWLDGLICENDGADDDEDTAASNAASTSASAASQHKSPLAGCWSTTVVEINGDKLEMYSK
ncbi:hypothetical protein UNDYM_4008 [Undibacterium sp. YM2]|uniref:hypothetical protein n=1 Tax=Undibacterium sp. YM2 TaxID=2058625 RepID=UPI001331C523|nr:hypothetical protein [Undibacterium sp. YM2]BBB68261.1 hypothetical protein UNDYM_4008 [Undibacterium sp. YM2]